MARKNETRPVSSIVFRAKPKAQYHDPDWLEGFLYWNGKQAYILFDEGDGEMGRIEVDPDTVGQYTGWQDAEGARIFDGDIIEQVDRYWVVLWGNDRDGNGPGWVAYCIDRFTKKRNPKRLFMLDKSIASGRICGNIFDGKEILSSVKPII